MTSALLARLNFALDLAGGRLRGTRVDFAAWAPEAAGPGVLAEALPARLVPGGLSERSRRTVEERA